MTAAGDAVLAVAYSQVGRTEDPPNSNLCSPYTDAWGPGAWCAMFVSWCCEAAGVPLPAINGPAGFSYCPDGQVAAYTTGHATNDPQPGDVLIFSWEPFYLDGIAYCSYGVYAGSPAGDHTGFWAGPGVTVEGNTSQSSWDNGGAVMERHDRYAGQICCVARHEAMSGPPSGPTPEPPKGWLDMLSDGQQQELYDKVNAIFWMLGSQGPTPENTPHTISAYVRDIRNYSEWTWWMCGAQQTQAGIETVSTDARVARANTERLLEG